jgi:hypothetical protein
VRLPRLENVARDSELAHRVTIHVDESGSTYRGLNIDVTPATKPDRTNPIDKLGESTAWSLHRHDEATAAPKDAKHLGER